MRLHVFNEKLTLIIFEADSPKLHDHTSPRSPPRTATESFLKDKLEQKQTHPHPGMPADIRRAYTSSYSPTGEEEEGAEDGGRRTSQGGREGNTPLSKERSLGRIKHQPTPLEALAADDGRPFAPRHEPLMLLAAGDCHTICLCTESKYSVAPGVLHHICVLLLSQVSVYNLLILVCSYME